MGNRLWIKKYVILIFSNLKIIFVNIFEKAEVILCLCNIYNDNYFLKKTHSIENEFKRNT